MSDLNLMVKKLFPSAIMGIDFSFKDDGSGNISIDTWNTAKLGAAPNMTVILGASSQVSSDLAKENLRINVNQLRDSKIENGIVFGGITYGTKSKDRINIADKAQQALRWVLTNDTTKSITWIADDNTQHTFTPTDFLSFADAVEAKVESLIFFARQLKDGVIAGTITLKSEITGSNWPY